MVKINANDFLDLLSNQEIKNKLAEILNDNFAKQMDKGCDTLNRKMDELTATINLLRMEIQSKDAAIAQLKNENNTLKAELKAITHNNDEVQQEMKRDSLLFTGFKPTYAEAIGTEGSPRNSSIQTKENFVKFCNDTLGIPSVNASEISSVHFLPVSIRSATRVLAVRFIRRSVRDEVYGQRRALKTYNSHVTDKVFINEDLTPLRRKIFAASRTLLKNKKISGCWTSAGSIYVKSLTGTITAIRSLEMLQTYE